MERAVAIKRLGKLLGKKLGYRVDDKAPKQDDRDAARAALMPAIEERNALQAKRDERRRAILEADAEYKSLCAESRAASERVDKLSSITRHYKFTVGTSEGLFFLIKAEGDSWEQIIDKLEAEQQKRVVSSSARTTTEG